MRKLLFILFCCFLIQNVLAQDHDYIIRKGNDTTYCDIKRITNKKIFFIYKNNQKLYNKLTDVIGYKQNNKEFVLNNYRMYEQKDSINPKTYNFKKNSITAGILPALYFNSIQLGYERKMTDHSFIEITGHAAEGFDFSFLSFSHVDYRLEYKYYFIDSTRKFINNIWFGTYLTQIREHNNTCSEGSDYNAMSYGIGATFGKRFYLTKKKKTVINLGFKISYLKRDFISKSNCMTGTEIVTKDDDYFYFRPGMVINFGFNF